MVRAGTDALFRCGTRLTANVLADAGYDVYLYEFVYHFFSYRDPETSVCDADRELLCGVYHASDLRFVWDNYVANPKGKDNQMSAIFQKYVSCACVCLCLCACACVRACMRACVCVCVRVCMLVLVCGPLGEDVLPILLSNV